MKLVFMGTPQFAVPVLQRLLEDGHEVAAVYTQPDKPVGRGLRFAPPPVKQLALEKGLPVRQPVKLRDGTVAAELRAIAPDLCIVVAYGRILPPAILEAPSLGCVNLHASLLPKYRGAAPIQWSVLRGETVTGVTSMFMAEGLDTGDIILQLETPIGPDETAPALSERLSALGAECVSRTLRLFEAGQVTRVPQEEASATLAPILRKEMGEMDFRRPAGELHNQVRGLAGWPAAYACFGGKRLKVHESRLWEKSGKPGEVLEAGGHLVVACGEGALELCLVQPEGKQRMSGGAFMNGYRLKPQDSFMER
ncbi:MAG: methionyl-tRNA formyltransferase [Provencibacterium sp.]|nr:methionyl-tRNA formyltransferase [Provencibacterium sp.]